MYKNNEKKINNKNLNKEKLNDKNENFKINLKTGYNVVESRYTRKE